MSKCLQTSEESKCSHCGSDNTKYDHTFSDVPDCFVVLFCQDCGKKSMDKYTGVYESFGKLSKGAEHE